MFSKNTCFVPTVWFFFKTLLLLGSILSDDGDGGEGEAGVSGHTAAVAVVTANDLQQE